MASFTQYEQELHCLIDKNESQKMSRDTTGNREGATQQEGPQFEDQGPEPIAALCRLRRGAGPSGGSCSVAENGFTEYEQRLHCLIDTNESKEMSRDTAGNLEGAAQQEGRQPEKLLRLRDVLALVPMGRATIYRYIERGDFPKPVKLGPRIAAWPESSIREWVSKQS